LSHDVAARAGNGAVENEARHRGTISGRWSHDQAGIHGCLVHNHIPGKKKFLLDKDLKFKTIKVLI
jgi:hypothetical protein